MNYAQQVVAELVSRRVRENGETIQVALDHLMSLSPPHPLANFTFVNSLNKGYSYCKSYMKRSKRLPFAKILARAVVYTKNWPVGEHEDWLEEYGGYEMREYVYEELRGILKKRRGDEQRPGASASASVASAAPSSAFGGFGGGGVSESASGTIANEFQLLHSSFAEEYSRAQNDAFYDKMSHMTKHYQELVALIMNGMPSYDTVSAKLGADKKEAYRENCETVEKHGGEAEGFREYVDMDEALEEGLERPWTKEKVSNRVQLLDVYCQTLNMTEPEASDFYARWRRERTDARNAAQEKKRKRALEWKLWRIRNNECGAWEKALGPEMWAELNRLDKKLHTYLGRGVYQHVPRRHFSDKSLAEMREENLPEMQRLLDTPAPVSIPEPEPDPPEPQPQPPPDPTSACTTTTGKVERVQTFLPAQWLPWNN